jgi:integrase
VLKFGPYPPSFHEIRSLASRLYEKEKGEEFAQRLLGHKNLSMTKKYLDSRGAEYVRV